MLVLNCIFVVAGHVCFAVTVVGVKKVDFVLVMTFVYYMRLVAFRILKFIMFNCYYVVFPLADGINYRCRTVSVLVCVAMRNVFMPNCVTVDPFGRILYFGHRNRLMPCSSLVMNTVYWRLGDWLFACS